ncbi:hypothetical protein KFL_005300050 [Klebsormidium nitens]|uniref:Hyaluronan/mRNA-binding protein domain-containing protein n=1 Tax=Klebsormidium nitens TaxID=105231 RepID=A0A1Y1IK38_KLENI|nr:hypothetical protein KFL_005300050 [Klebsormidium nitens]|eukprot:GAQ89501.1 hypothetical protein KFL_005300050 [Klebsormidium nitens]
MTGTANTGAAKHEHHLQVKKGAVRLERHSGSAYYGSPKKEGYGGWGKAGEELDGVDTIDPRDPNYDDDAEVAKQHPKHDQKAPVAEKAK